MLAEYEKNTEKKRAKKIIKLFFMDRFVIYIKFLI